MSLTVFPVALKPQHGFSFSASQRQIRCQKSVLFFISWLKISPFFSLHYCGTESRMRLLARPFVPTLGLSCWISLHADPPSRCPDTDTGVDIKPPTLVRLRVADFQIRSLYLAVTPSEASSAAPLTGEKQEFLVVLLVALSYLSVTNGPAPVRLRSSLFGWRLNL